MRVYSVSFLFSKAIVVCFTIISQPLYLFGTKLASTQWYSLSGVCFTSIRKVVALDLIRIIIGL